MPDPALTGKPIEIRYKADLRDTAGNSAHAATFIRERLIVLDHALLTNSPEHSRILTHELFHFVWVRLGNARRWSWEDLLAREWDSRARGEAGWSAEWRKRRMLDEDRQNRTRAWREYCCESFCDTASCIYGGEHPELTLAARRFDARREWFERNAACGRLIV